MARPLSIPKAPDAPDAVRFGLKTLTASAIRYASHLEIDVKAIRDQLLHGHPLSPQSLELLRGAARYADRSADELHNTLVLAEQTAAQHRVIREAHPGAEIDGESGGVDMWVHSVRDEEDANARPLPGTR